MPLSGAVRTTPYGAAPDVIKSKLPRRSHNCRQTPLSFRLTHPHPTLTAFTPSTQSQVFFKAIGGGRRRSIASRSTAATTISSDAARRLAPLVKQVRLRGKRQGLVLARSRWAATRRRCAACRK